MGADHFSYIRYSIQIVSKFYLIRQAYRYYRHLNFLNFKKKATSSFSLLSTKEGSQQERKHIPERAATLLWVRPWLCILKAHIYIHSAAPGGKSLVKSLPFDYVSSIKVCACYYFYIIRSTIKTLSYAPKVWFTDKKVLNLAT